MGLCADFIQFFYLSCNNTPKTCGIECFGLLFVFFFLSHRIELQLPVFVSW